MLKWILWSTFCLLSFTAFAETVLWKTPDFAIFQTPFVSSASKNVKENDQALCVASLSEAVCLVDPPEKPGRARECKPGSQQYAHYFQTLYLRYPPYLQQMMCHLKKIFIEKEFIGSAYAGILREGNDENGTVLGGVIGIRQALLDDPFGLDDWSSWKEQIHFGTDSSRVNVAKNLPIVRTSMQAGQSDMLYFLVAHELAHIFDFANDLNSFSGCEDQKKGCVLTPKPGTWGSFSWKTFDTPKEEFNFPLRPGLCFYFCDGKFISQAQQDELYHALTRTNFLSAYTTRYPTEDFADTFAIYVIMTEQQARYEIKTASEFIYDPISRLREDPLIMPKRDFISSFLNSKIKYPGDLAN